jgi:hypothetical protein
MIKLTAIALAGALALAAGAAAGADLDKLKGLLGGLPSVPMRDTAGNPCLTQALPDLTISEFTVTRLDHTQARYDITFQNIGQGCAGRFNVNLIDGAGDSVLMRDVGEAPPWLLRPGETVTISGQVERSQMWVYPGQDGYASHLGGVVNHGQMVKETTISNNGSGGKRPIRWGSR